MRRRPIGGLAESAFSAGTRLWIARRTMGIDWEHTRAFVVRARSEADVRRLVATEMQYALDRDEWADASQVEVVPLNVLGPEEIIMRDQASA